MPGLVPGIHDFFGAVDARWQKKTWMAGTRPAMTVWFGMGAEAKSAGSR
jgi:hypothetical protein